MVELKKGNRNWSQVKRHLLIPCYGPAWMRYSPFGVKPENSFSDKLGEEADPETKELLGSGG